MLEPAVTAVPPPALASMPLRAMPQSGAQANVVLKDEFRADAGAHEGGVFFKGFNLAVDGLADIQEGAEDEVPVGAAIRLLWGVTEGLAENAAGIAALDREGREGGSDTRRWRR